MKTLKRGMVIEVNLDPTLGAEKGKTRPCVVVTNDVYNARVPIIQVVPITAWNEIARIPDSVKHFKSHFSSTNKIVLSFGRLLKLFINPLGICLLLRSFPLSASTYL